MKRKYSPKNNQNEMTRLRRKNNFEQGDHEDKAALQKKHPLYYRDKKSPTGISDRALFL